MTWGHDVRASYKWKINNIFELDDSNYHRNKKRILSLAHLQAKIYLVSFVTSWRHVETLWRHMTWHLDNYIQLIVFWDDFSITSEISPIITLIGKKLRLFSSSGHSLLTFNVRFFQESMRVNLVHFASQCIFLLLVRNHFSVYMEKLFFFVTSQSKINHVFVLIVDLYYHFRE